MITPVEHKYAQGECVILKHDHEKLKRMITCIRFYKEGDVIYELACGSGLTTAFEYEFEKVKEYEDAY